MAKRKIGRNEPCYCGSGKKYKNCHMAEDRAAAQKERDWKLAVRYVRQDLIEFAQDERFAVPFAVALPLYWDGYYTVENADEMSPNEANRFFDWFAFDFQPEEGPRVLDVYVEERREDLSEVQQAVLDGWQDAPPAGAYILTGYDGQTLHLRHFLTGDEVDVFDPGGRGDAEVGDVILARLLPIQDHLEFSSGAAYIPQEEIGDLREKLDAARAADAEEHPDATVEEFLRRNNHLLIHHALAQAEKHGRPPVARLEE